MWVRRFIRNKILKSLSRQVAFRLTLNPIDGAFDRAKLPVERGNLFSDCLG
jgi:hypothetical protein